MHIIFIAEVRDPYEKGSSTQIMTFNLLAGLSKIADKLQFLAILDKGCKLNSIYQYYKEAADSIIPFYTKLNHDAYQGRKYMQLLKIIEAYAMSFQYRSILEALEYKEDTIVITHSPSLETIFIGKEMKKIHKKIRFIQYWSDPVALSGIYPEEFTWKRVPLYVIERSLLKRADDIVYGTKTLLEAQKRLHKNQSKKMRYIDVSYSPNYKGEEAFNKSKAEDYLFGYFGNYKRSLRNILPLYQAFYHSKEGKLMICGNGDVSLESHENIKINTRLPQGEINNLESKADVLVCLCNYSCIQLPGKIFYNTNADKIILIILDGLYAEEIRTYLEEFQRFVFCYNEEESIKEAIHAICSGQIQVNKEKVPFLSPEYVCRELCREVKL